MSTPEPLVRGAVPPAPGCTDRRVASRAELCGGRLVGGIRVETRRVPAAAVAGT